jgi:hypothetical protein
VDQTPEDISSLSTGPLTEADEEPQNDAPATPPEDPADELARKPTINLGMAQHKTQPLARLDVIYRSMTYPLIRLSRSSVLPRRATIQLTSDSANMMQDELRRAKRRVRIIGIALIAVGIGLMLITLYLWRQH